MALHVPVLLDRVVDLLAPALAEPGSVFIDATLGMGGHSHAVLTACPNARLVGIDRDPQALGEAGRTLAEFDDRIDLVDAVFDEIPAVLADLGIEAVRGALFDLGVSSLQLDRTDRGFAYATDAPLDMRMDGSGPLTAADVLNTYAVGDLTRIFRSFGEERFALQIARAIDRARSETPFVTSGPLVDLIRDVVPAPARRRGGHPAKRVFQALRIEVNDELGALRRAIPAAMDATAVGGRVVVMSYQSLEDRLVKQAFAARTAVTAPPGLPVIPESAQPEFTLLTRGAERASEAEQEANRRAAPVRLRAVERIREAA